ncbi:ATP-binding protein [Lysinibacillus irui]|uniref:histidine kinase n=1 Tax=Lysinibacillus irui TaxID=2998077 RepID=A0ABU5NPN4_9BACI|nr:ATP-binding protein [Lysinibacillus irui]MEA0552050.1 ATP-binding protein [Lysinibacillus irui]MEA0977975.1 ATP-binding protein [Lysinibacillus irui]MEA1044129.1 ATP-binding protein [Lysinibacillus irui]
MDLQKIARKYNLAVYSSALLFLLVAGYIHAITLKNPYTGLMFLEDGNTWVVASIDPAGKVGEWDIHIGDRLLTVDGQKPEIMKLGNRAYLKKLGVLQFEREGLGRFELRSELAMSEVYKSLYAACVELALLVIGLAAYRNKPESYMVRRFYALNVFMAATLLSVYSTETVLTGLILPVVVSWLPYLLFAFFVAFVFRTVPRWIGLVMAVYRVLAAMFAVYALLVFSLGVIPGWTRSALHAALIGTLLALFVITIIYWRTMDRAEKNQLLTFVAALTFGLLPYLFLYALPDLLWGEYIVLPDMTLAGLIVFPASILTLWTRQKLLDIRFYLPSLVINGLFLGIATILIAALIRSSASLLTLILCGAFIILTLLHRLGLDSFKRQRKKRENLLDQQRLEMSIRLAEHRNSRDLLRMLAELVHSVTDIEGLCFVWNRGSEAIIYGTGQFTETHTNFSQPSLTVFAQVMNLVQPDGKVIGYLGLGSKKNNTSFTPEELSLINKVRQETVSLLMGAALLDELRGARSELPKETSEYRLLEAQQAERIRLSYYLHDHVLQNLIFLARDLEELHDTERSDRQLTAVWLKCLYDTQRDIRKLCDDLYPHIIDQAGLDAALLWLARTVKENGGLAIKLDNKLPATLPPLYKMTLFRIVRELANNTVKHAKARKLEIQLWENDDAFCGKVSDDGIGFDPVQAKDSTDSKGFGLVTISSQVAQFGGGIEIESEAERGTIVFIRLPKLGGEANYGSTNQSSVTR